ncbi:ABC transporter permease [Aminobacter aganoensis]
MEGVTPEQIEEMRRQLGLGQPAWVQSALYVWHAIQGDFGHTIVGREPVLGFLLSRLPATLALTASGLGIAIAIGLPLGFLAAYNRGRWIDNTLMFISVLGISMPSFWLGLMLLLTVPVYLDFIPVAGEGPASIILPALTLGLVYSAVIARMTRSAMIEVLSEDFIRTARAKGLRETIVMSRHAFKPASISIVTVIGLIFGSMMGGQVIVENVFSWNGLGRVAVLAMQQRDYPTIQGFIILFAAIIVTVSVILDMIYLWIDPRVRTG